MVKPFFSVIIPTLNEEKYLPKLLKSLSRQTNRNFEVIVVDGNSADSTVNVFGRFKRNLPMTELIVIDRQNVSYQRNIGARKAKGTYLVFLDADCQVRRTFIADLSQTLKDDPFLYAYVWIVPDSRRIMDKILLTVGNVVGEIAHKLGFFPLGGGYSTIIRRDVFLQLGGFRPDVIYNEDLDFTSRALKNRIPLKILREPKVVYSMRRFRSEGLIRLLPKMVMGQIYILLVGPITSDIFRYRMGGHIHKEKRSSNVWTLTMFKKGIDKFEKTITWFLEG